MKLERNRKKQDASNQKHPTMGTNKEVRNKTHDCAFLEPLAFPPDLPPVILIDLLLMGKFG
jgi:hypothetical protein